MPKGDTTERFNTPTRKLYDKKFTWNREFRGVDGEGGNVEEPGTLFGTRHQYLSLRCGPELLETGQPLTWEDCFAFLADQKAQSFIYVAYFFDYDVTMMIRTLPLSVASKLLKRHQRGSAETSRQGSWTNCVSYGGFDFDYLPHKEFKIKRSGAKHWVVINDVGQFFQSTFLRTLELWDIGTPEERAFIAKGKSMRADFAAVDDEVRAYNALECLLLEMLMTRFRQVCQETGYVPKKWQGPGYLASAMLEAHNVPRRDAIPILKNDEFYMLALAAYYGGRFETTATGPIGIPVYQYDINGAYVSLLRELPCLIHGSWLETTNRPTGDALWFGTVKFTHDPDPNNNLDFLCHLPFRNEKGNISYPRYGIGTYWSVEINAAERAGTRVDFLRGWVYESHCSCRWFDFVDAYYERRKRLGKSAKGIVLKLAGNSIYGKLAQSIGYAPWANPVWAGLITAGCRALLIDAYRQSPSSCYMLATDGLFMGERLDLAISDKLGEWEETIHPDGIFIVQPGLYFTGAQAKSRGVERGLINNMYDEFVNEWMKFILSHGVNFHVKVPVTNFITARLAIMRRKWDQAGTWERDMREITFYSDTKRAPGVVYRIQNKDGTVWVRTLPYMGETDSVSVPYDRLIGGGLRVAEGDRWKLGGSEAREQEAEQPDWVAPLWEAPA